MIFAKLVQGERNGKKILFFVAIPEPPPKLRLSARVGARRAAIKKSEFFIWFPEPPNLRRQLVFAERSLTSANPSIIFLYPKSLPFSQSPNHTPCNRLRISHLL